MIKMTIERTDSTSDAWGPANTTTIGRGYREFYFMPDQASTVYLSHDTSGNAQLNFGAAVAGVVSAATTGIEATDLDDNVSVRVFALTGGIEQLIWEG